MTHEELNNVAKNNLVALEWVKNIQEVINFFIKFAFSFLIFSSVEKFNIYDVHFGIELHKFVVCNNSIVIFVNLLEKIHELPQESDVFAQLIVQDDVAEVMESNFWS